MNNWSVKKQANTILILSGIGILAAFPFQHTFAGGLLFAIFSAGTIGGLADSFAISALFGDPLRIKWPKWMGTHIISRNKERLIGELVDMVEKELLTVASIKATLEEHDLGKVLVRYLSESGGSEEVQQFAGKLAGDLLEKVEPGGLAGGIERFAYDHAGSLQVSDVLADVGEWTIRNGYDDKIINFVVQPLVQLVKSEPFRALVEQFADSAIRSYEGEKLRRRLVDFTAGLNAPAISVKVQDWLANFIEQFAAEDHPQRQSFKLFLAEFVRRLREDESLRQSIEAGKLTILAKIQENVPLEELLKTRIEKARAALMAAAQDEGAPQSSPLGWLRQEIDRGLEQLRTREDLQAALDTGVKSLLLGWIENKHTLIGRLVREKLNSFSEDELIELIKEKAGKDLQYIRLNGMVVGGLVGLVLYLLTFWIGGR
ncbi:DUF445 domain-containing protein [Paenibacillus sp. NPDC057967]|uniref:DUF445 domain-containing protein n=1 Tax=Paenibacillus sp. NPDC057967 TaxID=3346293 RepID=UPI0036DAD290